jgi:hypothetical protein
MKGINFKLHRMSDFLNYPEMIDNAMREVVIQALEHVSKHGLKNDHHFYITFFTKAFGVQMPHKMLEQFPEQITIVLQHQFQDLVVDKNKFSVILLFGGIPEKIIVPFKAITNFSDPSEKFTLEFTAMEHLDFEDIDDAPAKNIENTDNVIALDRFRDKNKK